MKTDNDNDTIEICDPTKPHPPWVCAACDLYAGHFDGFPAIDPFPFNDLFVACKKMVTRKHGGCN